MRRSEVVNLVYFAGLTILTLLWSLPWRSRIRAILLGVLGIGLTLTMSMSPSVLSLENAELFRDWSPVLLMAMAYWQSGCFVHKPNARIQKIFDAWDGEILRALRMVHSPLWARSWISSTLELTYLLCYPVVPLGVAALYLAGLRNHVDDYWFVVLLSAYPCYALLPFVQLLPPRSLQGGGEWDPSTGRLRRFNLWIVGRVTHQATTFPSGHVAASAAIALVLLRFVPTLGILFLLIAIGIALGCVSGRYHYAADIIAALILAGVVFAVITVRLGYT